VDGSQVEGGGAVSASGNTVEEIAEGGPFVIPFNFLGLCVWDCV
jgi:hypothetical protein